MKTNEIFIIIISYEDNIKDNLFLKSKKKLKSFLLKEDMITGEEGFDQMIEALKTFFEVKRGKKIDEILIKEEKKYEFENIPIKENDNKVS